MWRRCCCWRLFWVLRHLFSRRCGPAIFVFTLHPSYSMSYVSIGLLLIECETVQFYLLSYRRIAQPLCDGNFERCNLNSWNGMRMCASPVTRQPFNRFITKKMMRISSMCSLAHMHFYHHYHHRSCMYFSSNIFRQFVKYPFNIQ